MDKIFHRKDLFIGGFMETNFQDFQKTFHDLPLNHQLLGLLDRHGFRHPSHIQSQAIPIALEGLDLIGIAQTGTGKTLGFALPLIQQLMNIPGRALILSPTRELATQIQETFNKFAKPLNLNLALLIGGENMNYQIRQLDKARIIIATPGRLLDHIRQGTTRLDDVVVCVLDEADRMLDMGFLPSIEVVLKCIAKERQIMLFSATMPQPIIDLSKQHMNHPKHIDVSPEQTTATTVEQQLYVVSQDKKITLLEKLLAEHKTSTIIFCRRRLDTSRLARTLRLKEYKTAEIHADRTQKERFQALEAFKKGAVRILVATDVASRGLDISKVGLVINYDLPDESANYVHRIGRTGRAGKSGIAISFATPEQGLLIKDIEKLINAAIPLKRHPDMPEEYLKNSKRTQQRRFGGNRRRSSSHRGSSSHGHSQQSHGASTTKTPHKSNNQRRFFKGIRKPSA